MLSLLRLFDRLIDELSHLIEIYPFQIPNAKVLDAFPSPVDRWNIVFRNIDSGGIAGALALFEMKSDPPARTAS